MDKKVQRNTEEKQVNQFDEKIVAMSNALARNPISATHKQSKLFMIALSQLDPYGSNDPVIRLNKQDLFKKLGMAESNRYVQIKKEFKKMVKNSLVDLTKDTEDGDWYGKAGVVFIGFETNYKDPEYKLIVNKNFLPELQYLKKNYTTMELDDIISFDSLHTHRLYQYICSWNDRGETFLMTKQLKEVLGLEKEDYVKKDGKFDRYNFEKYTIDVAIEEINKKTKFRIRCEKIKSGNRVKGYEFAWAEKEEMPNQITLADVKENKNQKINWPEFENNPNVDKDHLEAVKTIYNQVMRAKKDRTFTIDGNRLPAEEIKIEYEKLTDTMIEQVLYDIKELQEVKNLTNWLYTTLYNAPVNSLIKLSKQAKKDSL